MSLLLQMKQEQETLEVSIADERNRRKAEGQRYIKAAEEAGFVASSCWWLGNLNPSLPCTEKHRMCKRV